MSQRMNNRINSIDWIKAIASFSVTAVHFRNRVERNIPKEIIGNKIKLFFSLNYSMFIVAVPLFILVTGYLSAYVKPSKKRYKDLLYIMGLYVFMAMISYRFMILFGVRKVIPFHEEIIRILKFDLISGWYLELFFGMYLLLPYFNIIFENLNRKDTRTFLIILLLVVSLPNLTNKHPFISRFIVLPNFYTNLYPFVYLGIGNYIRRYVKIEDINIKLTSIVYILSLVFITYTLYRYANPYTKSLDGYYPSLVEVTLSSSLFLILYKLFQTKINKLIVFISKYTLSTYIVSLPVDRILYPRLVKISGSYASLIKYSPLVVVIAFITALIFGYLLVKLYDLGIKVFKRVGGIVL